MREVGRRHDADGTVHRRVRNIGTYSEVTTLRRIRIGTGSIEVRLAKNAAGPGRRIVQLVADYNDAGVAVQHVVQCDDELDEARQLQRLERLILEAMRRPAL